MDGFKIRNRLEHLSPEVFDRINSSSTKQVTTDFGQFLMDKIQKVNRLQQESDQALKALSSGETDDIAQVMMTVEKADLALRLLMQVRNKLLEAYQEVMKTPV